MSSIEYPRVIRIQISVGEQDDRSTQELIDDIRSHLLRKNGKVNAKNVTIISSGYLIDGKIIPSHQIDEG